MYLIQFVGRHSQVAIGALKRRLADALKQRVPADELVIVVGGHILDDAKPLVDTTIVDGSFLTVFRKVIAGPEYCSD